MLSWTIFKRACALVLDDLGGALRISAVPYGLVVIASLYFLGSIDMAAMMSMPQDGMAEIPEGFALALITVNIVQLLAFLWIAVAWHRRVLLQEQTSGLLPPLHAGRMLGYLGRSLLIGLVVLALIVVIMVALAPIVPFIAFPLAFIAAIIIVYRLGLILPAGAVGKPITLGQAWAATKGQSTTMMLLALMTFVLSLLFQVPTLLDGRMMSGGEEAAIAAATSPVAVIYNLVVGWIFLMLGVSILSTLYAHFIERRPLE